MKTNKKNKTKTVSWLTEHCDETIKQRSKMFKLTRKQYSQLHRKDHRFFSKTYKSREEPRQKLYDI